MRRKLAPAHGAADTQATEVGGDDEGAAAAPKAKARRRSATGFGGVLGPKALQQHSEQLSNVQLTDLYSKCINLVTHHKVTQENAWHLPLIEYMDAVIDDPARKDTHIGGTNFQLASSTLDASVQIYSVRVDSAYSSAFKVLGGLSSTKTGEPTEEDEDADADNGANRETRDAAADAGTAADPEKAKPKRKRDASFVTTIETNTENLNAKKIDMVFEVDPLFHKTSAAFNLGGARGLLLNHLTDADAGADALYAGDAKTTAIDVSQEMHKQIMSASLCPMFDNFALSFPEAQEIEDIQEEEAPPMPFGGDDGADGDQAGDGALADSLGSAPFALAADEGDGGFGNISGEPEPKPKLQMAEAAKALAAGSECHYFDPQIVKNWAGPEHWKFTKPSRKTISTDRTSANEPPKKRRKKQQFTLDFSDLNDFDPKVAFAPPGKASTTLSEAALRKLSEAHTTLPVDCHYDTGMLSRLFTKPEWQFSAAHAGLGRKRLHGGDEPPASQGAPASQEWYEYHPAPQDAADNAADDDDAPGVDPSGDGVFFPDVTPPPALTPEPAAAAPAVAATPASLLTPALAAPVLMSPASLVALPRRPEEIQLNYAQMHRQVDVALLERSIWRSLCDDPPTAPQTARRSLAMRAGVTKRFTDVIASLRAYVPPSVAHDISVAFCFICLLHLCNTKGLTLENHGDMSQIVITKL
eukprot:TRINITY_DN2111_c0_g1_i1.p1 TRINITY_DN2111_c0_g1~~TRINITY_DN2111_c0_g1_i1.p1  ORF type:complete len:698 (+),score=179.95 TRINITY_DN2111_c0_g1_i1:3-2096(+)